MNKRFKKNIYGGEKLKISNYISNTYPNVIIPHYLDEYFNQIGRNISENERREIAYNIFHTTSWLPKNYYPIRYFLPIGSIVTHEMQDAFDIEIQLKNVYNFSVNNYEQMKQLATSIYERYHSPNDININNINVMENTLVNLPRGYELTQEMGNIYGPESGGIGHGPYGNEQRRILLKKIYVDKTKGILQEERQRERRKHLDNEFKNSMKYLPSVIEKKLKLNNDFDLNKVNVTNENFNTLRQIGFSNEEIANIAKTPLIIKKMLETLKQNKKIGEAGLQQMRNIENSKREQKKMSKENKNVKKY